jgi:tetraacyldisaccharide 4'-kinase
MPIAPQRLAEALVSGPGRIALLPLWLLWRPVIGLRNVGYDRDVLRARCVAAPVISVGNLTAGGTGKTPLVAAVVAALRDRGRTPWVLSRGYGGHDGANDEARMLDLPGVCDPDRRRGAAVALAGGADALVLDDGFQHRRLHRDLDIVCLDATRPWGRDDGGPGAVIPLGLLRESRRGLARAGLVVLTRSDQVPAARLAALAAGCERQGLPWVAARHEPLSLDDLQGQALATPDSLAGQAVFAVSGIGNPAAFRRSLENLGAQVVGEERFPDHHHYDAATLAAVSAAAARARAVLLTTAKDAVKWRVLPEAPADVRVLRVGLALDDPHRRFDTALDGALAAWARRSRSP